MIDEEIGVLYEPGEGGSLDRALEEIRARDLERARAAAVARARSLDWEKIAARFAAVYKGESDA